MTTPRQSARACQPRLTSPERRARRLTRRRLLGGAAGSAGLASLGAGSARA